MKIPGFTERESFVGADLRQATFDGRSFKMCDFRGADLTDAEFTYVVTHDPGYGRTDVSGAHWQGACLKRVTTDRVVGWPSH